MAGGVGCGVGLTTTTRGQDESDAGALPSARGDEPGSCIVGNEGTRGRGWAKSVFVTPDEAVVTCEEEASSFLSVREGAELVVAVAVTVADNEAFVVAGKRSSNLLGRISMMSLPTATDLCCEMPDRSRGMLAVLRRRIGPRVGVSPCHE